jgi:hypothetical protein
MSLQKQSNRFLRREPRRHKLRDEHNTTFGPPIVRAFFLRSFLL